MSVSGRAGAGGGGPHQGALPQTAEAMWFNRLGARGTTDGAGWGGERRLDGRSSAAKR